MPKEFRQLPGLTAADLRKNARFLTSCAAHYLPARFLKRKMGERYPDFENVSQDICLEGLQRSGNTYFVSVFQHWNRSSRVIHHTHLGSIVKAAVARGVPTAVLVRQPEDAIASIVAWDSHLSLTVALISYILFYRSLWNHSRSFVVLRFEDVIAQPDGCIVKINERFGTDFSHAPLTDAFRDNVFSNIEKSDRMLNRNSLSSSLPRPEKAELKARIKPLARANWFYPLALRWYCKYEGLAARPGN